MLFKKKKFISWKKYSQLLDQKDRLNFIQGTYRQSLKNEK